MANSYASRKDIQEVFGEFGIDTADVGVDRRTSYGKQMGRIFNDQVNGSDTGMMNAGKYYKPVSYAVSQTATAEEIAAAGGEKAAFSAQIELPTSSTDYKRPRTVAAAYDPDRGVMTVVFRDGTFYNYYQVTQSEWDSFHASLSKGAPWLNCKNSKQGFDGLFIAKPRGDVDPTDVDPQIREQLYRIARTVQQKVRPAAGKTSQKIPQSSTPIKNQAKTRNTSALKTVSQKGNRKTA